MNKLYYALLIFILVYSAAPAQGPACRTEARIDLVQSQYGLGGEGVLTIMMDRGIDYRHPDFIDVNGNTRIAYIYDPYDNSGANDPDNPLGVGTVYDSTEINTSLQNGGPLLTNDLFGHGTATTGIMAGDGSAVSDETVFRGVAHQSKIISIIVSKDFVPPFGNSPGQPGAYNPQFLPIAFQFAELKIAELALPSVTLLNIGSIQDPTDGSIALCDVIDDYVQNGHTFVCGVGDDGGKDNHMIETMVDGQATEFEIQKGEAGNLRFTAWYPEQDRFTLSVERPNGQIEGPFNPPAGPFDAQDVQLDQINIFHRGSEAEFANSSADLRQLLIDFSGPTGVYKVIIEPTEISAGGKINAFLNPARFNNDNAFLNNNDPGGNINSFSACPAVISPGDYVATNTWTDINGIQRVKTGEGEPGEIWIGSSRGPTMDGRLGIDLAAPGEIAAAAYGEGSFYSNFPFNVLANSEGNYGIQTAVSAAAPLVAGVIALMLEVNPDLTPTEIKTILQETAREDNFTGAVPNVQWGYGKLDALAAIERTFQTVDTEEVIPPTAQILVYPNPVRDRARIMLPVSSVAAEWSLSVHAANGQEIEVFSISADQDIDFSGLSAGIYFLRLTSGGSASVFKIVKY